MKKIILLIILVIVTGGLLLWLLEEHQGTVLISTEHYVVQFSLWMGLLAALVLVLLLRLFYGLLRAVVAPGWRLLSSRQRRRDERLRARNNRGLLAFAEGRWDVATRDLLKTADKLDASTAAISYLAAANAAAEQGGIDEALATLEKAEGVSSESGLAIGLTRARLCLEHGRHEQALAQLQSLKVEYAHQPQVLSLLAQCHQAAGNWDQLEKLLPDLQRSKVLDKETIFDLQVLVRSAQLRRLTKSKASNAEKLELLRQLWSRTHKSVRAVPEVIGQYTRALQKVDEVDAAETVIRRAISKNWHDGLVLQYGQLPGSDPMRQLVTAERWLRDRTDNADLLLTLGRLCKRNKLWGKGRDYLEASLNLKNRPETCAELAIVMAKLGEEQKSQQFFERGLLESVGLKEGLLSRPANKVSTKVST